jgi:hypothetical protein
MLATRGPALGPQRLPWQISTQQSGTVAAPSTGAGGAVSGTPASGPAGIWIAYTNAWNDVNPTRVRIDNPAGISIATGFSIRRGRSYITDKMDSGTASVTFVDMHANLDPTNVASPFWPMNPNCPCGISIQNPVTTNWVPLFTGLLQGIPQQIAVDNAVSRGSVDMADIFSMLALMEVPAGLDVIYNSATGTVSKPANTTGNTTYQHATVQDQIKALLADAGIPAALTNVYSGNVTTQQVTYAPGEKILSAIQDAADAEFSGVANLFVGKDGKINFRGRLARFQPQNYGINTWNVTDTAGAIGNPNRALLQSINLDRDVTKIVNNALFTPQGIADTAIHNQLVVDTASVARYGPRSLTGMDLINAGATTGVYFADPAGETKLFGTFYVTNQASPAARVSQAAFKWVDTNHPNAAYHWNFLCNVEIDDIVSIRTTHPGGGGFGGDTFFVEGITYDAQLGPANQWDLTLTLDLSPAAYYVPPPPTQWIPS